MVCDIGNARREPAEHCQGPMRGPRNTALATLLRELDGTGAMTPSQLRWSRPHIEQKQCTVHTGEQRRVTESLGDFEGALHRALRFLALAEPLKTHAFRDQRSRL